MAGCDPMLIEKEIIAPGSYFYTDEASGLPRKLDVTPELTRYWNDQGAQMLKAGLTVPVPYEHDFSAHPMTPKDKLLNNAGWVKEYRVKDAPDGRKDVLFGVVDVLDPEIGKKLPHTIRWTSPWINSFTDGAGKQWNNVISHLALTTRPRITKQAPFGSIAAALSMATPTKIEPAKALLPEGFCLSRAGRLVFPKGSKRARPMYPVAFSLHTGVALGPDDMPGDKKKDKEKKDKPKDKKPGGESKSSAPPAPTDDDTSTDDDSDMDLGGMGGDDTGGMGTGGGDDPLGGDGGMGDPMGAPGGDAGNIDLPPFNDPAGDVGMEELLSDLLGALGIHVEHTGGEEMFKRALYNAAMTKIHELTGKAQNNGQDPNRANPPGMPPNNPKPPPGSGAPGQANPLIQQEQQPMYMSLEDIHKLPDSIKGVALAMYAENQKLRSELDTNAKTTNSLRDAKLGEVTAQRAARVNLLGRLSPRVKADLDAMLAMPSMALSMGDGGAVTDPMAQTLAVLEKGLADLPRLLTTEQSALSVQPQPQDADMLTAERADAIADSMARMMGCPPEKKAS